MPTKQEGESGKEVRRSVSERKSGVKRKRSENCDAVYVKRRKLKEIEPEKVKWMFDEVALSLAVSSMKLNVELSMKI